VVTDITTLARGHILVLLVFWNFVDSLVEIGVKPLVSHVVVSRSIFHLAIHRCVAVAVPEHFVGGVALNLGFLLPVILAGLLLFNLTHQPRQRRSRVTLKETCPEDCRNLAVLLKNTLVEHLVASEINHVTFRVD